MPSPSTRRTRPTRSRSSSTRAVARPPSTTTFGELNDAGEPARQRSARGRRAAPANGSCGAGRTRSRSSSTIHAARKCNLVAVPLSYRFNAEEMQYVIDNSDATVVVVDAEEAAARRVGPRPAPEAAHGRRLRRRGAGGQRIPRVGRRVRGPVRRPSPTSRRRAKPARR